ncbi:C6 transcription factor [Purpureocillium lavendulum]|uniref:C6 transcription factor n=1 Tax=Purpureocillium lavendulum TaxID=1247861 RepID=A0AB34FMM7_9HYPO|nr:C6 transcription factor [Purpureocillium lavendulum]
MSNLAHTTKLRPHDDVIAAAMETISSMATQAAKAVWGDSSEHKEPLSGAQGDVSHGEPYDAGNLENGEQKKLERKLSGEGDGDNDEYTTAKPISDNSVRDKAHDTTTATSTSTEDTTSKTTDPEASTSKPSEIGSKAEEEGDPNTKVMGDGPKPLETVAREHGGDAGNNTEARDPSSSSGKPDEGSSHQEGSGSGGNDGDSKGTGEQYVKTSGFAADGGDFDATKPGAGREADRLLEEKGVHHDAPGSGKDSSSGSGSGSGDHHHSKDKPSLGERIKNKLHRH